MTTRIHKVIVIAGATLLALALSAAVAFGQASGAPTSSANYVPPSDSMSGQSMLELIIRSNREAIRQARAALAATRSADTRRFAESIISDNTTTLASATALWDRLNYTRPDSSTSTQPMAAGEGMGAGAIAPADTMFDRTYATSQVALLEALSTQLKQRAGTVRDPSVRSLAIDVQSSVDRQLAAARQLATPPAPKPTGQ